MQFKHGAEVVTAQGHRVGSVDRVVMDPNTKEVSAIVVRKGVLFVDDKLVPVSRITSATVNHVTIDVADFDQLPNFIETEYIGIGVPQEEVLEEAVMAEPLYWYPPIGSAMWGYPPMTGYPPELPVAGHKQIPEGLIALHEGARVMSSDGRHVGDIERVITEEADNRVTHFVLTKGLLFPEKKLLPMAWVKAVDDEQVQLNVETAILEQVRPYFD